MTTHTTHDDGSPCKLAPLAPMYTTCAACVTGTCDGNHPDLDGTELYGTPDLDHEQHGGAAGSFRAEGCSLCPEEDHAAPECPGCGRVMSNREAAEQGACNDCNGGAW